MRTSGYVLQIRDRGINPSEVLRQLGIIRRFLHHLNDDRAASVKLLKSVCNIAFAISDDGPAKN